MNYIKVEVCNGVNKSNTETVLINASHIVSVDDDQAVRAKGHSIIRLSNGLAYEVNQTLFDIEFMLRKLDRPNGSTHY